ncbi:excisionase [Escherichia coli]|nr:excisionase [Escherichia coli]
MDRKRHSALLPPFVWKELRQRRPRSLETVRRWVRECRIFPPPVKDGREYLFHESAVKVDLNRPVTGSLLKRIRNGKKAKS